MAGPTSILSANALTQTAWPETMFKYMLQNMIFSEMMGQPGSDMPIIIDRSLVGRPGDQVMFKMPMPWTGVGLGDDGTLEGSEETMAFHNMPMTLHERVNGAVSAGIMTDKRAAINILSAGIYAGGRWAAEQVENDLIYAITGIGNEGGYAGEGGTVATVNASAPSTNRILRGGQTVAGVYASVDADSELGDGGATDYKNYLFGTKVIEALRTAAQLATPKIQPVNINGKHYYVLVYHPLQRRALRAETGEAGWQRIQANAGLRGDANFLMGKRGSGQDRMFNGIDGIYDDVILYCSERMPTRVAGEVLDSADTIDTNIVDGTARVGRCALLGAQACVLAWGQNWRRLTKNFDYGRKAGVGTDAIYAVKKTVFRDPAANQSTNTPGDDFGVYVADTCMAEVGAAMA